MNILLTLPQLHCPGRTDSSLTLYPSLQAGHVAALSKISWVPLRGVSMFCDLLHIPCVRWGPSRWKIILYVRTLWVFASSNAQMLEPRGVRETKGVQSHFIASSHFIHAIRCLAIGSNSAFHRKCMPVQVCKVHIDNKEKSSGCYAKRRKSYCFEIVGQFSSSLHHARTPRLKRQTPQ